MPTTRHKPRLLLHRLQRRLSARARDDCGEIPMRVLVIVYGVCLGMALASALVSHYAGGFSWWTALAGPGLVLAVMMIGIGIGIEIGSLADARTERQRRVRDERGVSTLFVVLFATAMLAVAGLVIDGGYALGAKRQAMNHAEQAARVGADALDEGALRSGDARVNTGQAIAAAQAYLNQVGARGSVSVAGGEVTVTVTGSQDTTILSAVGVTSLPVRATATALSIDEDSASTTGSVVGAGLSHIGAGRDFPQVTDLG